MGLNEARKAAIECLRSGKVQAVERDDIAEKNLLKTGVVSPEEVIALLQATHGSQHRTEPHNDDPSIEVHFFEPQTKGAYWHVKLYFLEPDCWFISVHKSHVRRSHGNFQRRR